MCVVSMVGDFYNDKWDKYRPFIQTNFPEISRAEFDALRKEVLDMKILLEKALQYDKEHNQPQCQIEDKMKLLKAIAKLVGVDLPELKEKKDG